MTPKKKIPEPLVGWAGINHIKRALSSGSAVDIWPKTHWPKSDHDTPAALVALPRELRPGETVEVRIVEKNPIKWAWSKVDGAIQRLELEEADKRERAAKRAEKKPAKKKKARKR